jgi:1-deoxyxylulose-5-phosphate synthase
MLTGKHDRKAPPPAGTRFALGTAARRYQERYWNEKEFETIEALRPIAAEVGNSMTTMALSWVLANPAITAPIVGASRPEQLAESLAALPLDFRSADTDKALPRKKTGAAENAATEKPLPVDLKARLDNITYGWRAVDADR